MSTRGERVSLGLLYLTLAALTILVALGAHIYRWEMITWLVITLATVWFSRYSILKYREVIAALEATINGQQEMLKDTISELSRRNKGLN